MKDVKRRDYTPAFLFFASLLINLAWVFAIPPFDAPDEPAHVAAVREIHRYGALPEVHFLLSGTGSAPVPVFDDGQLLEFVHTAGYVDAVYSTPYESSQAPLFYVVTALISWPFAGDVTEVLYITRMVSALFGAVTVALIWATVRQIAPRSPALALACAVTVMALPQFAFNSGYATNDSALNMFGAAALFIWLRGLRQPDSDLYLLLAGLFTGLAVLSKLTALALLPALAFVMLSRARNVRHFLLLGVGGGMSFLAVTGWWFVRNFVAYGEWTGMANTMSYYSVHFDPIDLRRDGAPLHFFRATFESTLGRFGWMDVPLPLWVNLTGLCMAGSLTALTLVALYRYHRLAPAPEPIRTKVFVVLLVVTVSVIVSYVLFSTQLAYQPQGRYLFLLLVPMSLLLNYGIYTYTSNLRRLSVLSATPAILLVFLNLYSLLLVARS